MSRRIFTLLFAALSFIAWVPARAQGSGPPIPERPPQGTYILDTLDWLSAEQESEINEIINLLDQEGITQIVVVTLDDCGADKVSFRKSLFQNWGIGHADDQDGLLILVCWYGGDTAHRTVEQEFGPGLNGFLSGEITDRVAKENFIPAFKNNNPGDGLLAMVKAYDVLLHNQATDTQTSQIDLGDLFQTALGPFIFCGLFPLLGIILFIRMVNKNSGGSGDYSSGDFGGADSGGGGDSGSSTSF